MNIGQRVRVAPLTEEEAKIGMDGIIISIEKDMDTGNWYMVQLDQPFMDFTGPIEVMEMDLTALDNG